MKPPDALSPSCGDFVNGQADPLQNAHAAIVHRPHRGGCSREGDIPKSRSAIFECRRDAEALSQADESSDFDQSREAATVLFPPQDRRFPRHQVPGDETSAKLPTKVTGETNGRAS